MNRIHKKTMTDEEREENGRKFEALLERELKLDSDNEKEKIEYEQILKEESDLGYSSASSHLAESLKDKQLAEEYRKRTMFQLKIEYDREKTDKESTAKDLYKLLKKENRREEALMWFLRSLRQGGIIYANGDKDLLRKMLDINHFSEDEEDLDWKLMEKGLEYSERLMQNTLDMMEEDSRKNKTTTPDILVCGPDRDLCQLLIDRIVRPDFEPADLDGEDFFAEMRDDSTPRMIHKTLNCGFANIIEAKTIFGPEPELTLPPGKTMRRFVRAIENERAFPILNENDISWSDRIDAVWYVTNGDCDSISDQEREFIHSMMELPNAMLVVDLSCTVVSREKLPEALDALTEIVDPERIVLVGSGYYGQDIDAKWRLIEATRQRFQESNVFTSDEEVRDLESAWGSYFEKLLPRWHERSEKNVERCIRHAAGRAQYIVEQGEDLSLSDLIEEGCSLLKELFDFVRGDGNKAGDEPELKKDVSHSAELLSNITIMIYELAGCCGHAAVRADVTAILSACKASDLPEDAAAITYAVGMTAKAYFESDKTLPREELKAVFAKTKEEGLQISFEPMFENDPETADLFDDFDEDDFDDEFDSGDEDDDDDGEDEDEDEDDDGDDDLDNRLIENIKSFRGGLFSSKSGQNGVPGKWNGDGGDDEDDEEEEIDYGDGYVAASSGSDLDFPDNYSGKKFRLPDDHPSPADVLKTDAVSGGWGYTIRDAAVIQGGIPAEHAFIEVRTDEEIRRFEELTGRKIVFADYQKYAQELISEGDDSYDLLFVQIALIAEEDWEQLKEDWESHDGYKNDKKGRRKHQKWRESRTIRFTEHFWFNVNALFSFDDDDDDK